MTVQHPSRSITMAAARAAALCVLVPLLAQAQSAPSAHSAHSVQPAARVAAPQDTAAARAEVLAVVTRLFDGMRTRDTASMRALFHPAATLMSSSVRNGVPTISSDSISNWIASVGRAPQGLLLDERLSNTVVRIDDGLASVWTEYELWLGERFSHCGVDAITLGRTATGWKVLSVADTRRQVGCRK